MAATPAKQRAVKLEEIPGNRTCDWEDDIYTVLESGTDKFNCFSTLLQEFVVPNPRGDPEILEFMNGLYGIVKCQLLRLQEQNTGDVAAGNDTEEDDDVVVVDPQYKHFLDNFRADGKSYVLDIIEDGVFVKYENANHVSNEANVGLVPEMHARTNYTGKRRGRKPKLSAAMNPNVNSSRVASEAQKHAGQNIDHRIMVNHTDTPSGIATRVIVEIEDSDDDPPDIRRPVQEPVLKVEHRRHDNEASARKLREFREKLMEVLKMPCCEEEYERLLQTVSDRKPVQRHKDLRGRIKIYEEDYPGKSFLDHHVDLAKKIDSVRDDHPRVLNLLRGFFYWLMHLSHEGAFLPWRDPSCLDVLPQQ